MTLSRCVDLNFRIARRESSWCCAFVGGIGFRLFQTHEMEAEDRSVGSGRPTEWESLEGGYFVFLKLTMSEPEIL